MATQHEQSSNPQPVYRIRIKGHLPDRYSTWFGGMTLQRLADGDTVLVGPVADQAALHALLRSVRDLGLSLVAVDRADGGAGGRLEEGGR